jgi:hypothetical protein
MSEVSLPIWSLCPFRSPVAPTEAQFDGRPSSRPAQALGPCLYAGCGLWKITKIEDGRPVDGMCSIRFLGEVMNSIAGSLEQLTKLETMKTMGEGQPSIFKG